MEEVGIEQDSEMGTGEMEGGSGTREIEDDKRDKGMRSSWTGETEEEMELRKGATVELGEDATENQSQVVWDRKWNLRVCEIRIISKWEEPLKKIHVTSFSEWSKWWSVVCAACDTWFWFQGLLLYFFSCQFFFPSRESNISCIWDLGMLF